MKTAAEYFTERYGHSYNGPMDSIEAIKFATAYADEVTNIKKEPISDAEIEKAEDCCMPEGFAKWMHDKLNKNGKA